MATETAPAPPHRPNRGGQKRTVAALWREAIAQPRRQPAYLIEDDGEWKPVSLADAAERVEELANGLLALGVRKGDVVSIVGRSTLDWALLDFALAQVGAITAPIYPNTSAKDCAYILEHSRTVTAFVEDDEQLAKVAGVRDGIPGLRDVFSFSELDDLAARGRDYRREHPGRLAEASAAVDEDDNFVHQYTSGTTAPPKTCMVRKRNYYEMVAVVDRLDAHVTSDDVMLLWLPLAHNFGRLMHLVGPHVGYTIAFVPDPTQLADALPKVRPTILPSAPRVFEKVYGGVKGQFDAATGMRRKLIDWALAVGYRSSPYRRRGERLPPALALQHRAADRLVYQKVKERLGGRLRIAISGAAPLAWEIAEFFHALDFLIPEGYGLSECTTASNVNRIGNVKFGTVGPPLPGFEVRTTDDGEVLIRSETVFAGYYGDEEATRAVLTEDGWSRSGDVGEIDDDGFLRITDRKKDLIVTAGGKNVAPQNIENALKSAPLVSQALVVGDRRPYVGALITLDEQETAKWAAANGLTPRLDVLAADPRLREEVQKVVDDVNLQLSRPEQVKRFEVLPRDFSAEEEEITPTLKLRRRVCEQHFADAIEALYR